MKSASEIGVGTEFATAHGYRAAHVKGAASLRAAHVIGSHATEQAKHHEPQELLLSIREPSSRHCSRACLHLAGA